MAFKSGHVIECGIPVPFRLPKYPFKDMDVGESVFLTFEEREAATNAAHHIGVKLGRKFTTRRLQDGVRIWRTL